jgi:hypothetical protein
MSLIGGLSAFADDFYFVINSALNTGYWTPKASSIKGVTGSSAIVGSGSFATDSTGDKVDPIGSIAFQLKCPRKIELAGDLLVRVTWEITTQSAGTPFGKVKVALRKNGSAIGSLTPGEGAAGSLAATVGSQQTDTIVTRVPKTTFDFGDTLDLRFIVNVSTASGSGGSTAAIKILCDPTSSGKEPLVRLVM